VYPGLATLTVSPAPYIAPLVNAMGHPSPFHAGGMGGMVGVVAPIGFAVVGLT